ncbi:MAG: helicase associated domain-containing protein, partial [Tenericutes bacterium]|nr:helicase associated domain-containing protein [Mycoplasmatota bacterium]
RFENIDAMKLWMDKYNLAKIYYEHYSNLEIPQTFKTVNGYEYDENGIALGTWVTTQRKAYKGKGSYKITENQIHLLEEIGMKWFSEIVDSNLQQELITDEKTKSKKEEIMNRFTSYLNHVDNQKLDKETINQGFIDELNRTYIKK